VFEGFSLYDRCKAHLWLEVEQGGSFIIGFVKGVLFAARQGILLCAWCCSLLAVVSAGLAFLLYD
jgi:hypothetical protein